MMLPALPCVLALVAAPALVACEPDRAVATVLLATDSGHWGEVDVPALRARVTATCSGCEIDLVVADGDAATQEAQLDAALEAGTDVVVVEPVDPAATAGLVTRAGDVPVVAWGDLVDGADFFVGPDPGATGRLLGEHAERVLPSRGRGETPRMLVVDGPGTDPTVTSLLETATAGLRPADVSLEEVVVADAGEAEREVAARLKQAPYAVVLAGSDELAEGAARGLEGVAGQPALLGPGARLDTARRIVTGDQAMSVHEPYERAATQVADVVVALLTGGEPRGGEDLDGVRSWPFEVEPVTLDSLTSTMVHDGAIDLDDLCAGPVRRRCTSLGLL